MKIDPIELRNALGSFATGVCVITANPKSHKPFGMTVNSFASVSLEPALVLWSLQNDSDCLAWFEESETFCINILADDQQALSNSCAKKGDHVLDSEIFQLGKSGTPVLHNVASSFECRVWARYPGGDHTILVGEVLEITSRPEKAPLLFHAGKYGLMAQEG